MVDTIPAIIALPLAAILWCVWLYQIRRDK
jgi:hypothetical protein